jgi:hypothetical protein
MKASQEVREQVRIDHLDPLFRVASDVVALGDSLSKILSDSSLSPSSLAQI